MRTFLGLLRSAGNPASFWPSLHVTACSKGLGRGHPSHVLILVFVRGIVIIIVIILLLLSLIRGVGLLLLGLLDLAELLPLLGKGVRLSDVIGDDDVIKDGAALNLPEVEADEAEVIELVDAVVVHVLRIGDLLGLPEALVRRVGDPLHGPIALVGWIVLHRGLPLAVLFIIPVIWLLRLRINNALVPH